MGSLHSGKSILMIPSIELKSGYRMPRMSSTGSIGHNLAVHLDWRSPSQVRKSKIFVSYLGELFSMGVVWKVQTSRTMLELSPPRKYCT